MTMTSTTSGTSLPLAGLRALEWSTSIAGAYAGRLLADAGVTVTRLGGAATLGRGPELDGYLHLGKERREGDLADLVAAAATADLVVLELPDAPEDGLLDRFGDAAVVVITPFGLTGPWAGTARPWSELTLQLEGGALSSRGSMDSYPVMTGSSEALWIAGSMAAGAVVTALQGERSGRRIDLALLDVTAYANNMFQDVSATIGQTPRAPMPRMRLTPGVEPASDGWVGFNLASAANHQDFLVLMERPEWLADEQMSTFLGRYARYAEWVEAVRAWTRRHTVAECVEAAGRFRIPAAPVHDGASILHDEQVVARDFYETHPSGAFTMPRPPFLFDGVRPERGVPSTAAEHTAPASTDGLPFAGLRVLDLGTWWVGAYVGAALGAGGADVVKVESTSRIDGSRTMGFVPTEREHWWDLGNIYLGVNVNKRDLTLDLATAAGRELLVRMIGDADVLIENYAPRVLEAIGLDWDAVHEINPRLVMLRMPAFGLTGPRREMVGYAQTVEQFSGLCWRTGYPGGDPTNPSGPADPMGAASSFFALSAALLEARRSGRGILVEATLAESAMVMASEQVLAWTGRGELLERTGNRSALADVQGVFAVRGTDEWVGLSVLDDAQWRGLVAATGFTEWLSDPALADRAGRQAAADRLEAQLADWFATHDADEAVEKLLGAGVPAGRRTDWRWVHEHPQLAGRGTYTVVEHPYAGEVPLPGLPYQRVGTPSWITRRPPLLGEHNEEILCGELGLSPEAYQELVDSQVVGTRPAGQ
ncbi:CaiB/BaiF CoA-transferase family protein [Nocardioides ochotonae]|uniref:CaiB/BaiF CoA-transferase family protein n=1 Tax=Nocardioides ochotonae TaxID=2685869 RepID=UPI0014081B9B|nr:CoA transferase [Nocardioides ochotonae]